MIYAEQEIKKKKLKRNLSLLGSYKHKLENLLVVVVLLIRQSCIGWSGLLGGQGSIGVQTPFESKFPKNVSKQNIVHVDRNRILKLF